MSIDEEALHTEESRRPSHTGGPGEEKRSSLSLNPALKIPEAPHSNNFRLPTKMPEANNTKKQPTPPRLMHPVLHSVPMHIRFGLNGFLSNVLFMVAYNIAVVQFEGVATASTIYSIVYLIFIPISHAFICLLVFGWPERYLPSLMSNTPIGLTAIALGATLTAYLDRVEFNKMVIEGMAKNWAYMGYKTEQPSPSDEIQGEFYSSLVVLLITGIWTFILSVFINSPPAPSEKKEN